MDTTARDNRRSAFPSPLPSPSGRRNSFQTLVLFHVCVAITALESSPNRRTAHPLPRGEGRGEGKRFL